MAMALCFLFRVKTAKYNSYKSPRVQDPRCRASSCQRWYCVTRVEHIFPVDLALQNTLTCCKIRGNGMLIGISDREVLM